MRIEIILGLLYGDEGKGNTVAWRVSQAENPIVVRFGGGSQCGHTVYHKGRKHVFQSFGSGTFHGAPTYLSENVVLDPVRFQNERELIKDLNPQVEVHPETMIVTPWDKAFNRWHSREKKDTTGMGFGPTIQRNEDHYHLHMRDLYYQSVFHAKMKNIEEEYSMWEVDPKEVGEFYKACSNLKRHVCKVKSLNGIQHYHDVLIFEGHQGILLDQHYGFFPYVTRSNTTSKNAWDLIQKYGISVEGGIHQPRIYYVMRSYLTRHGDGFATPILSTVNIDPPYETNVLDPWQGEFRKGHHSTELLQYALEVDMAQNPYPSTTSTHVVITCLDQTNDMVYIDGEEKPYTELGIGKLIYSKDIIPFKSYEHI